MFRLPQSPTAFAIAKSGPATSSTHNKGKLVLPPPLSRSCSIKWFNFHTGIPWTSAIFSTIRRRTTTWWHQMMRTSPTASLRSSAHSRMKTRQAIMTIVWNRQKINTRQAQEYLEGLTLFWMQQKESYHEFSESLKEQKEAVKKISMTGLKQKFVLDYFSSA